MSAHDRFCSLIPDPGVKLSTIILAGPTVLSAVGACPPHDGVSDAGGSMLQARSPFRALAKNRAISPPPPSRQGRHFPLCRGNPVVVPRYAAASFLDQLNSVPWIHIRCRMTASLRATATLALRSPLRLASLIPQAFSADHFGTRVSSTPAASSVFPERFAKGTDDGGTAQSRSEAVVLRVLPR